MPEDERPSAPGGSPAETDEFAERLLELDTEEPSPFLRGQKRVPVRRGALPRKAANRLMYALLALVVLGTLAAVAALLYRYSEHSWRFRLESSDQIEITGIDNVSRGQVMEVLGGDIGRNVNFIPLQDRKKQLEEIPWVESATVMRLLPNRLQVQIHERTPVAFVKIGSRIALIDRGGVLLDAPQGSAPQYSFPVIVGMGTQEPLSTRAARMKIYDALVRELDSEGARYSQDLREVNLSDPEDVKITVVNAGQEIQIHLGSSDFLRRYKIFVAHVQEWRQRVERLDSVDLRYDRQVVVNPDSAPVVPAAKPAPPAAKPKAASAPRVKHAAVRKPPAPRKRKR